VILISYSPLNYLHSHCLLILIIQRTLRIWTHWYRAKNTLKTNPRTPYNPGNRTEKKFRDRVQTNCRCDKDDDGGGWAKATQQNGISGKKSCTTLRTQIAHAKARHRPRIDKEKKK